MNFSDIELINTAKVAWAIMLVQSYLEILCADLPYERAVKITIRFFVTAECLEQQGIWYSGLAKVDDGVGFNSPVGFRNLNPLGMVDFLWNCSIPVRIARPLQVLI